MLYTDGCKFIHEKVQWIITLAGGHDSKQFSNAVSLKKYFWSLNAKMFCAHFSIYIYI